MSKGIGPRQKAVLDALVRHKTWHDRCGWVWNTLGDTKTLLDTLVKRGYVATVEKKDDRCRRYTEYYPHPSPPPPKPPKPAPREDPKLALLRVLDTPYWLSTYQLVLALYNNRAGYHTNMKKRLLTLSELGLVERRATSQPPHPQLPHLAERNHWRITEKGKGYLNGHTKKPAAAPPV